MMAPSTIPTPVLERAGRTLAAEATPSAAAPRVYYLHPLRAGGLDRWGGHLGRAADAGFTHLLTAPLFHADNLLLPLDLDRPHAALVAGGDALDAMRRVADLCARHGLMPLLEVPLNALAAGGATARAHPQLFRGPDPARALDPRSYSPLGDVAVARFDDAAETVAQWWSERLRMWLGAGMRGFHVASLARIGPASLRALTAAVHDTDPAALMLGWTPGMSNSRIEALRDCGLDYVFSALPDWNFRDEAYWEAAERLRRVARVLAPVETPFGPRLAAQITNSATRDLARTRAVRFAAASADGWLMPMGFERNADEPLDPIHDAPEQADTAADALLQVIMAANRLCKGGPPAVPLSAPGADVVALRRGRTIVAVNASLERPAPLNLQAPANGVMEFDGPLAPGEVRFASMRESTPVHETRPPRPRTAEQAARTPRVAIEAIAPSVDGGRFAAKRVAGEPVDVTADVICDGHDHLAVVLMWRAADEPGWHETRMRPLGNDVWTARFTPDRVGRWLFTVEAWRDEFDTWRDEISKKHAAGIDIHLELIEGRELVAQSASRAAALAALAERIEHAPPVEQLSLLLGAEMAELMAQADTRPFATRHSPPCPLDADRVAANFAAWYEIFPRSMSDDPARHGTFRDVIRHLPRIRDMGFDVLYFPPIHPIGQRNRKGRNNAKVAEPGDVGSPYAIGNRDGGHDAIHPELGTLGDFQALRDAALQHGLELALDFAVQCAPDHPWLAQHHDWFDWRPDGSLRYAENPPKKYEDIVNVDFYAPGAVPELWVALCDVVLFWAEQGVRIFRVDNPHTKPLPFWEWLIAEVRAAFPDALFLAEAFTRPKVMNRLGKIGFTQSYTYFTWRNTRRELEEYLTELTSAPVADFFRPNFFVNTPDINPPFLQTSGRPGFLIRAALAATLSGVWGVYSGFELCEATPVPGREEYLDSEKYQIRAWDWQRRDNIVAEIAALNRIRRRNPALHRTLGLRFLPASNDQVLFYEKATPDRSNVVLVAISLDPRGVQSATIEAPLWLWRLPDAATVQCDDLMDGTSATWQGKWQTLTLTPEMPFRIWRATPA